jgi:hypothetical protein
VNLCLTCKETQLRKKKEEKNQKSRVLLRQRRDQQQKLPKKLQCNNGSSEDLTIKRSKEAINQQEIGTIDRSKTGTKLRISSKKSAGVAWRAVEAQQTEGDESHP